mmetsp:Transcript_43555/g.105595  ORF Transcript_43555/g.105595 Transcript_43555/m.105595 type:complete len:546 (-) Transcript_43555:770-2407(-)
MGLSFSYTGLAVTLSVMLFSLKTMGQATSKVSAMSSDAPPAKTKTKTSYDMIVVGGGSAGLTAAKLGAGTLKKEVLLVEQAKLGGDCTWTGCVPSKSLLAKAKAAKLARSKILQQQSSSPSTKVLVDWKYVKEYYTNTIDDIFERDDSSEALSKFNVDTLQGKAVLTSSRTMNVVDSTDNKNEPIELTAEEGIILCTGATPYRPDSSVIEGLDGVNYLTYEEIWEMDELPKRITICGGGPIGCEMAQALARLGSEVTIVASRRLLPREEPEVSEILKDVFENDEGIKCVIGRITKVKSDSSRSGHVAYVQSSGEGGGGLTEIVGDTLLLSLGRKPNMSGLGLEVVGIDIDPTTRGIAVNDKLQTSCKGIYAAGDCTGDRQFTHYAGFQGAIAARNILLPLTDPGVLKPSEVPATTFTSPEVASIGLSEKAAREEYGDTKVAVKSMKLDEVDRAVCDGETKGILKVMYLKKGGTILGATCMCPSGGELISEISVAMKAGMSFPSLAKVIHPYPSYAIALQIMAADIYYEETAKFLWLYNILKKIGL